VFVTSEVNFIVKRAKKFFDLFIMRWNLFAVRYRRGRYKKGYLYLLFALACGHHPQGDACACAGLVCSSLELVADNLCVAAFVYPEEFIHLHFSFVRAQL
jgi:hypothetical protein